MKQKDLFIIIIILLLLSAATYFFITHRHQNNIEKPIEPQPLEKIEKTETSSQKQETPQTKVSKAEEAKKELPKTDFTWKDLGIKPIKSIEGSHYVFTAFDFDDKHNTLMIAGSYPQHLVKFIKNGEVEEIEINDVPMDILWDGHRLYILGMKKFTVIKDRKIVQEYEHQITSVTTFDKLLMFDAQLNVLMSDGSAYQYSDGHFSTSEGLLTQNKQEIWVKKTSSKSFEIQSNPKTEAINQRAVYKKNIGSITLLGNQTERYFCIVETIENTQPLSVKRLLKSSTDYFQKTVLELPKRQFAFIKNDLKIHQNKAYTLSVSKTGIGLKSTDL